MGVEPPLITESQNVRLTAKQAKPDFKLLWIMDYMFRESEKPLKHNVKDFFTQKIHEENLYIDGNIFRMEGSDERSWWYSRSLYNRELRSYRF